MALLLQLSRLSSEFFVATGWKNGRKPTMVFQDFEGRVTSFCHGVLCYIVCRMIDGHLVSLRPFFGA